LIKLAKGTKGTLLTIDLGVPEYKGSVDLRGQGNNWKVIFNPEPPKGDKPLAQSTTA